ncbi:MAG: HNH endonuclease [Planctomycetes bacterium]|nr:HNH endonuclease [Planctomycetota bacterium]
MARKAIGRQTRQRVRKRAGGRCEYCRHPDSFACSPFACEHVIPRARGAGDAFNELAWACAGCNSHKYDKVRSPDPESGRQTPLFNPRRQRWSDHFRWSDDGLLISGQTPTGRATVAALHLNRPELIHLRSALISVGEHPPTMKPHQS